MPLTWMCLPLTRLTMVYVRLTTRLLLLAPYSPSALKPNSSSSPCLGPETGVTWPWAAYWFYLRMATWYRLIVNQVRHLHQQPRQTADTLSHPEFRRHPHDCQRRPMTVWWSAAHPLPSESSPPPRLLAQGSLPPGTETSHSIDERYHPHSHCKASKTNEMHMTLSEEKQANKQVRIYRYYGWLLYLWNDVAGASRSYHIIWIW